MISDLYAFPPDKAVQSAALTAPLIKAHRSLAELKGVVLSLPNQDILLNTLSLQEAKDSTAIENIITSNDELFKEALELPDFSNAAAKEVGRYAQALRFGFEAVQSKQNFTMEDLLGIQRLLVIDPAKQGLRARPGTVIGNPLTRKVVYEPPQDPGQIRELMEAWLAYFIEDCEAGPDPLVRMALLHYQFEKIHPFYDGNGRTGRIMNLLYLVLHGLLDLPVLYLSRFIIHRKGEYLRLFREDPKLDDWEEWLTFMLLGIEVTSMETIKIVHGLHDLMAEYHNRVRNEIPKIYSLGLINTIFKHPYTKIDFLIRDLNISRPTASSYLNTLANKGFLEKQKVWKSNYYINQPLYDLLQSTNTNLM